jgi:hypothetical protein
MADIAAGDVTYTVLKRRRYRGRSHNLVRLAFGNGTLTYPANGIPISKGKLGCPNDVESMQVVDQGASGYRFQYDQSAEKLIVMQTALVVTKGAVLASGEVGVSADAATATLNNNTIAATLTLKSASPAQTVEASTMAIAAQTIEVEVVGW